MTAIVRYRGDTVADRYVVKDASGAVVNITGCSFKLTINSLKTPPDITTQLCQIVGVIVDAATGIVDFPFTVGDADQVPGVYFYDIEMTDASGAIETLVVDKYTFKQDITK